jgi:hypothetical protein
MIDLFKYTIVSVAIATVSLVISDLFKERDQDVKELEYFDKYVEDVKKADGILERFQLSKYLSIVAPSVSTLRTTYFIAEPAGLPLAQKSLYDREPKAGSHVWQG